MSDNKIADLLNSPDPDPSPRTFTTPVARNTPTGGGETVGELAFELDKLLTAGKKDLPAAAADYHTARTDSSVMDALRKTYGWDLGGELRTVDGAYSQWKEWGRESFGDIPQTFEPYAEIPRPESFDPMINAMDAVLDNLSTGEVADDPMRHRSYSANPDLHKVPGIDTTIDGWTGSVAVRRGVPAAPTRVRPTFPIQAQSAHFRRTS